MEYLNKAEGSNFHTNLDDYEIEDLPNVMARFLWFVCVEADVTNNFVFKKPKCDDKTYTNL